MAPPRAGRRPAGDDVPELDLTQTEPEQEQSFADRPGGELVHTRRAADWRANLQEVMRSAVAWVVLALYAVIEWRLFNAVRDEINIENIDRAAAVLVTPLVGIVGTVLGFYFGQRSSR